VNILLGARTRRTSNSRLHCFELTEPGARNANMRPTLHLTLTENISFEDHLHKKKLSPEQALIQVDSLTDIYV